MNRKQQKKIKPSVSFSLFLDVFSSSVLTDDKETMPTYDPDDAVRAGGVMKRHHFQEAVVNFSIFTADTSSADISDPTKIHKHNTEAVILTVQNYLMSVLEVTKLSYFILLFSSFFSHKCCFHHCRSCSTTKALKQMHRNQELEKCCNSCV